MAFDIHQEITNRIIAEIETGTIPWKKPWIARGGAVSYKTGKPYSLLNQMLLGEPGEYVTYKQAQELGGQVRKGAKSKIVVFWKQVKAEDEETGEVKLYPVLRYYNVFHIRDVDGLSPKHEAPLPNCVSPSVRGTGIIHKYLIHSGVTLRHVAGDRAYYTPATDTVILPRREQFKSTAEYYSTAFHELSHSTGHASRLDRLDKVAAFGSDDYSKEELVAEIAAASLTYHAGLETASSFKNSAAYVQGWLTAIKNDKRLIVSAAGRAEKAVSLILG